MKLNFFFIDFILCILINLDELVTVQVVRKNLNREFDLNSVIEVKEEMQKHKLLIGAK